MINPKVVDLYHGDDLEYTDVEHDFAAVYESGIRGVIHKATEGLTGMDSRYHQRELAARQAGLLWGAYHFMRPGDPVAQAQHFLSTIVAPAGIRLVLDHEDPNVPLWGALRFLQMVRHITGQTPWLYSGFLIRQQQDGRHASAFAEFPLWLAEYGPEAKVPHPWTKCVLWQFTDGHVGPKPHAVAGIAHESCDISSFDGTDDELRAAWLGQEGGSSVTTTESTEQIILGDIGLALQVAEDPALIAAISAVSPFAAALMKFLPVIQAGVKGVETVAIAGFAAQSGPAVTSDAPLPPAAVTEVVNHLTPGQPNSPTLSAQG